MVHIATNLSSRTTILTLRSKVKFCFCIPVTGQRAIIDKLIADGARVVLGDGWTLESDATSIKGRTVASGDMTAQVNNAGFKLFAKDLCYNEVRLLQEAALYLGEILFEVKPLGQVVHLSDHTKGTIDVNWIVEFENECC